RRGPLDSPPVSLLPRRARHVTAATGAFVLLLLVVPSVVLAHAELVASEPSAGATVGVTPAEIVLTFNSPLVADRSSFVVIGPGGEVGRGGVGPDASDTMVLAVSGLAPGSYEVRWTAVAQDGHNEVRRDTFAFSIAEPTPAPATPTPTPAASPPASAAATPAATVTPTPRPTASPEGQPAAGGSGTEILFPIIVALAVLGGIGASLLRRSRAG
ncbi:MAG TPA: copper resistance CopC family protein, partial [Candidatus Limnocylindrales bacterium]|nr:copper resistance CopC family protein [Candidatus Limnocylindrales bacterium]